MLDYQISRGDKTCKGIVNSNREIWFYRYRNKRVWFCRAHYQIQNKQNNSSNTCVNCPSFTSIFSAYAANELCSKRNCLIRHFYFHSNNAPHEAQTGSLFFTDFLQAGHLGLVADARTASPMAPRNTPAMRPQTSSSSLPLPNVSIRPVILDVVCGSVRL